MKRDKSLKPTSLRLMLTCSLLLIAGLGAAGFAYSYKELQKYAIEVSHTKANDVASASSLQTLQTIQAELKKDQVAIQRADSITATGELPEFEAIADVKAYAARNHLTLQSIDFSSSNTATPSPTRATPTTPAPIGSTSAKSVDVTISFGDEVNYKNFLQFISDIQHNIPKMQVGGIDLSKGSSPDKIKSAPLTIHMYTR